ncbi:MAG: pseudouridine synthase, partial [Desulfobacterales bacterium]|nr:pseudouridine synthase [Desulfobacterales bacterium]
MCDGEKKQAGGGRDTERVCGGIIGQDYRVGVDEQGKRLDVMLGKVMGMSRSQVKRLLEAGRVSVDGRGVGVKQKGRVMFAGEVVRVDAGDLAVAEDGGVQERIVGEAGAYAGMVIREGDGWVFMNKPAGMAVHPLRLGECGTVLNAVAGAHPQVQGVGEGGLRSGVVHRLDVTTSGVLFVAVREDVWLMGRAAFTGGGTEKDYLALVSGAVDDAGKAKMHLKVARHNPAKVVVVGDDQVDGDTR